MKELHAVALISPITYIASHLKMLEIHRRSLNDNPPGGIPWLTQLDKSHIGMLNIKLKELEEQLFHLEMKVSLNSFARAKYEIEALIHCEYKTNDEAYKSLNSSLEGLILACMDELDTKTFLSVSTANADLYSNPISAFNENIFDSFPKCQFDLEEGGKCYALGCYTACIFHLMRAMEAGVAILADELDAAIKNKNSETLPWGILTANIGDKIQQMPRGPKRDEWEQCNSLLFAVNRAWRTKGAHPNTIYTQEQAKNALGAVKSFLDYMIELKSD